MNSTKILRKQLIRLLDGGNAHVTFDQAVADFPMNKMNSLVPEISCSCWQLLEHIRIAQWDILEFIKNPNYKELIFPEEYWLPNDKKATEAYWNNSIFLFQKDLQELKDMVKNPETDFFAPIPHAKDYTIFREIVLVADHNAYHLGQLVLLRKILGIWK